MAAPRQFMIDPLTQTSVRTFEGHEGPIQAIAAPSSSTRQRYMVTASADNTVGLWNLKEGVLLRHMKGHRDWVRAVAVSPKGRNWPCIASGDDNGELFAWKEETKAQIIDAHPGSWICSLDFSPDGAVLATGSEDKSVKLWNTETWQPQGHPINCGVSVNCVRYSPSGKFIAVATTLGIQMYRSTGGGDCIQKMSHLSPVLAWTPNANGERLLSAGHRPDCTIREWHSSTWKQVHDPWIGHTDDITAIAVNYNGALVASASEDKHVRLWGLSDRETIMIFQHSDRVRSVIFSFDCKHVLSGGDDKKISEWAIPEKAILQEPEREPQIVSRGDDTVIPALDIPEDAVLMDPHGERASNISQQYTSPVGTFELVSPAENIRGKGKEESTDGEHRRKAEKPPLHDIDKVNLYANRSKAMLENKLWKKALINTEKVTELNPSSYLGYQLEHAALHGAHRYDEAIEVFQGMLSKLDNAPDTRSRGLRQQFLNQSEAEDAIQTIINTQLDNTPIRVLDTDTGLLCDRQARASAFKDRQTYKELLSSTMAHADRRKERIEEVVRMEFQCVMSPHGWEEKEPLLRDIGTNVVDELSPVGGVAKLLSFCRIARDAGYHWAWSDTDKTKHAASAALPSHHQRQERHDALPSSMQVQAELDVSVLLQDLTKYITKVGDYAVARGGFGEIWKCTYSTNQGPVTVAVKSLVSYASDQHSKMEKQTQRIQRELRTCARLKHPNILPVYGYTFGFGPFMAIVSPWAENGNLIDYMEREDTATLTVVRRFQILRDIMAGLKYLHANNVIHGDLTGPNVLIHADGTAYLADFGLSLLYSELVSVTQASWTSSFHGNLRWLAPELLGQSDNDMPVRPTKASDVYSFGGIMLHVLTNRSPFYYLNDAAVIRCIYTGEKPNRLRYPALSGKYWNFIEKCWSAAVNDRPSTDKVAQVISDEFDSLSSMEPDREPHIVSRGDDTAIPALDIPEDAVLMDPHGERASNISQQYTSPVGTYELVSPAGDIKGKGKEESIDGEHRREAEKPLLHDIDKVNLYANRSKAMLEKKLWKKALIDAEKVTELNPSSYLGYQLEHAALHGAHRYDEAITAFQDMLSKLDNAPDTQSRELRHQFLNLSEAEDAIQTVIDTQLDNTPIRVLDTDTGLLCDRWARASIFKDGKTYKELLSSIMKHAARRKEHIEEVVRKEFQCVMLSHRWEGKEPLLHDIGTNVVYELSPVGGVAKLLSFCRIARDAGYRWAWSDTCCIDKTNNAELQQSLNAMFVWYHHSALTIIYLSDVLPSSRPGALAKSKWNTRGWTIQEFLAPKFIIFFQKDWTLYLGDPSDVDDPYPNHKDSAEITQELKDATKIDLPFLVSFQPGMKGAREKLQWASARVTTVQEDIAYSLFGIFGVQLPLIYSEGKQSALGRLLQEIVARSCDLTALDWIGQSSGFNSCLPADISSYKAPPHIVPPLSEDQIQISLSSLRNATALKWASKLFTQLNNLSPPRFASCRLHLPCIAFRVTEIRRSWRDQHQGAFRAYEVKADGLYDLLIITGKNMNQFPPTPRTLYLVRPWDRDLLLQLPSSDEEFWDAAEAPEEYRDRESSSEQALRLSVHLGQPFSAFLLERQHGNECRRIASDRYITARIKDMANVHKRVTTLEIV